MVIRNHAMGQERRRVVEQGSMRKWGGMTACVVVLLSLVVLVVLSLVVLAGAAVAQEDPYDDLGNPKGEVIEKPEVNGERPATTPEGSILAYTGADLTLLAATGVVLVLTGTAVVRRVRSTRVQTD